MIEVNWTAAAGDDCVALRALGLVGVGVAALDYLAEAPHTAAAAGVAAARVVAYCAAA